MTTSTRSFTEITAPQRSDLWHAARLGRLTGSRASDMLATVKSGEAAGRRNLRTQLVLERITHRVQENNFQSPAMQQGIDREVDAYGMYETRTEQVLTTTGFLRHNTLQIGCSLDGHVGDFEGLIEIKCPLPATHLTTLRTGVVDSRYIAQITHALWITGAQWCDFVSYNPDFPTALQMKIVRVHPNAMLLSQYTAYAMQFLREVDAEYDEITSFLEAA